MQNIKSMIHFLRIFDGRQIKKQELQDSFALEDLEIIKSMYIHAIITDDKDGIIILTSTGKFMLYFQNYSEDIQNFGNLLESIGLDTKYFYEYISHCYPECNFASTFNISNYEKYLEKVQKEKQQSKMLLLNNRNI